MADGAARPKAAETRPPTDRRRADPNDPAVRSVMAEQGLSLKDATEIVYVQGHAGFVGDGARAILGARFGGVRIADEGHVIVRAVHLTTDDEARVRDLARQCGIAYWLRFARAERSEAELAGLTEEVTQFLRHAGASFGFGVGPRIPEDRVELTMATGEQQQRIASLLEAEFQERGLCIVMKAGFQARRP
jgi:hypothetical protein